MTEGLDKEEHARQLTKGKTLYHVFDTDGDGIITKEEFVEGVKNTTFDLKEWETLEGYDADHDGSITRKEFQQGLHEVGGVEGLREKFKARPPELKDRALAGDVLQHISDAKHKRLRLVDQTGDGVENLHYDALFQLELIHLKPTNTPYIDTLQKKRAVSSSSSSRSSAAASEGDDVEEEQQQQQEEAEAEDDDREVVVVEAAVRDEAEVDKKQQRKQHRRKPHRRKRGGSKGAAAPAAAASASATASGGRRRRLVRPRNSFSGDNETRLPDLLQKETRELSATGSGNRTTELLIQKGLWDCSHDNYRSAAEKFSAAIYQSPDSFVAFYQRGAAFAKLGQFARACKDFSRCIALEKTGASAAIFDTMKLAHFNRGVARATLGAVDEAIDDFSTAISMDGTEPDFYHNRALLHRRAERYVLAQRDYQMVRTLLARDSGRKLSMSMSTPMLSIGGGGTPGGGSAAAGGGGSVAVRRESQLQSPGRQGKQDADALFREALRCEKRQPHQIELLVRESRNIFRNISIVDKLGNEELRILWRYIGYAKFPVGHRLFEMGDNTDFFYVIYSGSVSVRVKASESSDSVTRKLIGDEVIVNTLHEGTCFGESVAKKDDRRKAACVTEEPTEVLMLDRKSYLRTFHLFVKNEFDDKLSFLKSTNCFASWDQADVVKLAHIMREKTYPVGSRIINQGDQPDGIFFIYRGMVDVLKEVQEVDRAQPTPVVVARLASGDIFGEAALFVDTANVSAVCHPSTIVADTKVVVLRLDKGQIDFDMWHKPEMQAKLGNATVDYPEERKLVQQLRDQRRWLKAKSRILKDAKGKLKRRGRKEGV